MRFPQSRGHVLSWQEKGESTMTRHRAPYPEEFKRRMVELVRAGRSPTELAREFEPSSESIRLWAKQADLYDGRREDGLTSEEKEELRELRREVKRLKLEREILKKGIIETHVRAGAPGESRGSRVAASPGGSDASEPMSIRIRVIPPAEGGQPWNGTWATIRTPKAAASACGTPQARLYVAT